MLDSVCGRRGRGDLGRAPSPRPLPEVCAVISRCAAPMASGTHLPTRPDGLWAREPFANHHFGKPRSAQQAEEAEAWSRGAGLWVGVMPGSGLPLGA